MGAVGARGATRRPVRYSEPRTYFSFTVPPTAGAAASLESLTVVEAREGPLLTLCQIINRLGAHQRSHSFSAKPSSLRVHFLDLGET
jgi:hypothetical protein